MRKTCDDSAIDDDYGVERSKQVQGKICHTAFEGEYSGNDYPGETDQFPSAVLLDRKRQAIAGGYSQEILNQIISPQNITGIK